MKVTIIMLLATVLFAQEFNVKSYYGVYDANKKVAGHQSSSLSKAVVEQWKFSNKSKHYKIAVLVPHLKDPYFLSVNYGVLQQANKNNISFKLYEAGGYNHLGDQRKQFYKALKDKVDGIILASISYDKLDRDITKAKAMGIPVVEVINDIQAQDISAKSLVSFYDMGYKVGEYITQLSKDEKKSVAFLPGPDGSGWAPDTYYGFLAAIKDSKNNNITVYKPLFGDTGEQTQATLIKRAFHFHENIDYLVGNAVMAQVAPEVLKSLNNTHTKVFSTYIIPQVYELILEGKVIASPADKTAMQAMIAVDMLQKILDGKIAGKDFPFRTGPVIPIVTTENIKTFKYEELFGKKRFEAIFSNN
jgi:periplasmic protein TorT